MFRCPNPQEWPRVNEALSRVHEDSPEVFEPPPKPPILKGWAFSSASKQRQRWVETVAWASAHGCSDITSNIADADYVRWATNESAWQP